MTQGGAEMEDKQQLYLVHHLSIKLTSYTFTGLCRLPSRALSHYLVIVPTLLKPYLENVSSPRANLIKVIFLASLFKYKPTNTKLQINLPLKDGLRRKWHKTYMRFDTKMTSLLCQPTGPQRRVERSRPDDVPKKALDTEKSEKPKEDDKASSPTKEAGKVPAKKEDSKPQTENESGKKGTTSDPVDANQKDNRKAGLPPKKVDPKRGRGGASKTLQNNSRFGTVAKKFPQNRFGQQRWQDRQGGLNQARRGGVRNTGRGSGFVSGRSRFDSSGSGFRSGTSPGRMQMGGMGGRSDTRAANFGGKRNSARAGFSSESYEDVSYPKRSNLGVGRSWADETEDLGVYRNNSSLGYGTGGYGDEVGDYADDSGYDNLYSARSGSGRLYGGTSFGTSARNLDYSGSAYDYGY
ncbi:hypothetical protein RRG08_040234 [Elysia crispata]|uniref:Uncharacterized protein n=1 Tax=Elysia crispata TaxID=231223 RepID=A0AAE1CYJ6_9GAST|nr:hypothetical protein RRG08_040234 [Elysia crispata]